jgi:hypothetical protein
MTTAAQRKMLERVKTALESYNNASNYFDVITAQYQYINPNLNVVHDPVKGRGIKATKNIPAGTVLISNPSGLRCDLSPGMDHRQGNMTLGLHLFERLTQFGFNLDMLSIPNDTLGSADDFDQLSLGVGDDLSRGPNAKMEYPLADVFPIRPEYLCPNLTSLSNYPNPLLYVDADGNTQHVPLGVSPNLPVELRDNLINSMKDKTRGYPLLLRCMLMAQENSVLSPYNAPFLLPNMFIKPKPLDSAQKKDLKAQKPPQKKSTPKVLTGRKGTTLTIPAKPTAEKSKAVVKEEKEEKEEKNSDPLTYNFFEQIAEDNGNLENIPATLLTYCTQLIRDEEEEEEDDDDDEDEEEEPQTAKDKFKSKGKKAQEGEEEEKEIDGMDSRDSLVIFPTFAMINHDCAPNSTPLFFHLPTDEYLAKLYKEHKETLTESGPATFNLPREASLAACAVVVALHDIQAGEELSINYTPLAHCETSPALTAAGTPIIQYIPWMQEFRQSTMKRIHNMLCQCKTCQTDIILQKALGAKNAVLDISVVEKSLKVNKEEQRKAKALLDEIVDSQQPLTPFTTIPVEFKEELYKQDLKTVAQRLLLHTVVLSDKRSTFNRNMVPLLLFQDRSTGEIKPDSERGIPTTPDEILERLHALTEHPLWQGLFNPRGGWDTVQTNHQHMTVHELFATSQDLLNSVVESVEKGRKDSSSVVVKDVQTDDSLKIKNVIPVVIPSGFTPANMIKNDTAAPCAIVPSDNATLIPTIASLDVTSALSTSIGIYAAISAAYERIAIDGLPEDEDDDGGDEGTEPEAKASSNTPETDLLIDGDAQPAGTEYKKEKDAKNVKTRALINVSDGSVIQADKEMLKLFKESQTYREMIQMLEAILAEVLGLNESEGRKEYIMPTHWFIATILGVLNPLYIKVGAHSEALIAALYLALITGLSVPLTDINATPPAKIDPKTPKEMRDAKKINDYWTFHQATNPAPGSMVKPLHSTLNSLFVYFSDSLEQVLRDVELALQYSKYQIAQFSVPDEKKEGGGEDKETNKDEISSEEKALKLAHYTAEFDFASKLNEAIWFLGQSVDGYTL